MSTSSYGRMTCECGYHLTSAGFAVAAHNRGKHHIAHLRATGQARLADQFEREAARVKESRRRHQRSPA